MERQRAVYDGGNATHGGAGAVCGGYMDRRRVSSLQCYLDDHMAGTSEVLKKVVSVDII